MQEIFLKYFIILFHRLSIRLISRLIFLFLQERFRVVFSSLLPKKNANLENLPHTRKHFFTFLKKNANFIFCHYHYIWKQHD